MNRGATNNNLSSVTAEYRIGVGVYFTDRFYRCMVGRYSVLNSKLSYFIQGNGILFRMPA